MKDAMNRTLTSGTPRTISMKTTEIPWITPSSERLPSASPIAIGRAPKMPPTVRKTVSGNPPQRSVGTRLRPSTLLLAAGQNHFEVSRLLAMPGGDLFHEWLKAI
jgi:hypothetical protein